jgi:hypothetical protein
MTLDRETNVNPTPPPTPADAAAADAAMTADAAPPRRPLGALLVEAGLIDELQLERALREGAETGERLGEVVVRRRWATEDDVARLLAKQWGLNYVERSSIWFDADALTRLSREDAQRLGALPTRVEGGRVVVAVAEPTEQRLAALEELIGDTVMVVVPKTALDAGLHSELLASHNTGQSREEDALTPDESEAEVTRLPLAPVPPPEPGEAPAPASGTGLDDVATFAAQARQLAELLAAQAEAATDELSARAEQISIQEELAAARRRIEELESELGARRVAMQELKHHLEAARQILERGF